MVSADRCSLTRPSPCTRGEDDRSHRAAEVMSHKAGVVGAGAVPGRDGLGGGELESGLRLLPTWITGRNAIPGVDPMRVASEIPLSLASDSE